MKFFKKLLEKKRKEIEAIQILLDFAEGRMCTERFWEIYREDHFLRDVLKNKKNRQWGYDEFDSITGVYKNK